jgi:hypothetical protein
MDCVLGLPMLKSGRNSIFMVLDRLFKMTYFMSYHKTNEATNIAYLFFREIAQLHSVNKSIISDCDVKFSLLFLKGFIGKVMN